MLKPVIFTIITAMLFLPAFTIAEQVHHNGAARTENRQTVTTGKLFTVILPSNKSTGYTWILRTLPSQISLVSYAFHQSDSCKADMTGCGGEDIYTFRAEKTGTITIEFLYGRPWERKEAKRWDEHVDIMPSATQ